MDRFYSTFISAFLFVLFSVANISAENPSGVEIRVAAFIPTAKRFARLYQDVSASYEVEAFTKIYNQTDAWVNFDWFSRHKSISHCRVSTRVNIDTLSLGLKWFFDLTPKIRPYIGIGAAVYRVMLHNKSICFHERRRQYQVGGVFKSGFYFDLYDRFYVNLFFDYYYQPTHFSNTDVGGIKTGIGLGMSF